MTTENIKEIVKEKYAEAAKRATSGEDSSCCGTSPFLKQLRLRSHNLQSLRRIRILHHPRIRPTRQPRLRQSHSPSPITTRRNRPRSRLRRRHRRPTLRPPRSPHRQSLRPRHDRRNASPGQRKQIKVRPNQRRIPTRRNRKHPPPRKFRRRNPLQLRNQSFRRQRPSPTRSLPRPKTRRPLRRLGRSSPRRSPPRNPPQHGTMGRLYSGRPAR